MSEVEKPTAAFVLSLVAGVLIIIGGGMMSMISSFLFNGMMGGYRGWGMMGYPGYAGYGMMGAFGHGFGFMGILGLIFGVIVIISAIMLNSKPQEHITWGTLIIIFSALSMFGGAMGFGLGLILGIIGGVLAVTWKPSGTKK